MISAWRFKVSVLRLESDELEAPLNTMEVSMCSLQDRVIFLWGGGEIIFIIQFL
jgi:hypothetical protein